MYYHRLGTSQFEDILIYKDPENPEYRFSAESTLDGQFIIIETKKGTSASGNKLYLIYLRKLSNCW